MFLWSTSVALVLAGCGSDTGDTASSDTDGPTEEDLAVMKWAELATSGSGSREAVVIGPRTYRSETVRPKVTGFFKADGSQELNKPASITDEDQPWIQYGVSGAQELNVLVTTAPRSRRMA